MTKSETLARMQTALTHYRDGLLDEDEALARIAEELARLDLNEWLNMVMGDNPSITRDGQ